MWLAPAHTVHNAIRCRLHPQLHQTSAAREKNTKMYFRKKHKNVLYKKTHVVGVERVVSRTARRSRHHSYEVYPDM